MALQEFFQGFKLLVQGARDLSTSKALTDAQDKINELKESDLTEFEKRDAQRNISNQVARQLLQFGNSASSAQIAASAFAPSPLQLQEQNLKATGESTIGEALAARQQQAQEQSKKEADAQQKRSIEQIQEKGRQQRLTQAERPSQGVSPQQVAVQTDRIFRNFSKNNDKLRSKLDAVSDIQDLNQLGTVQSFNINKRNILILAGESGRFTNEDVQQAGTTRGALNDSIDSVKNFTFGKISEGQKKQMIELANTLKKATLARLKRRAQGVAKTQGKLIPGLDTNKFADDLVINLVGDKQPEKQRQPASTNTQKRGFFKFFTPSGN